MYNIIYAESNVVSVFKLEFYWLITRGSKDQGETKYVISWLSKYFVRSIKDGSRYLEY